MTVIVGSFLNRKERGVSQILNRSAIARLHQVMISLLA
jgi:hypothetical protein